MINSANKKRVEALVERSTKHGQAGRSGKSPTYLIWQSMIGRCHRPTDSSYKYYGAKGVIVCERWRKFENFFEDMGTAPEGTHIHMRDDATIYSKKTCQWLNEKEHIGLHNQQRGWGARLNKAQLIDRVVALQDELAAERQRTDRSDADCAEAMKQLREQDDFAVRVKTKDLEQQLAAAERQRREQEVYETPPSEDCPTGIKWSDIAKWNGLACEENQKLLLAARKLDLSALHEHDAELLRKRDNEWFDACCGVPVIDVNPQAVKKWIASEAELMDAEVRKPLVGCLRRLINELPTRRDWLDPDLEKFARALLREE